MALRCHEPLTVALRRPAENTVSHPAKDLNGRSAQQQPEERYASPILHVSSTKTQVECNWCGPEKPRPVFKKVLELGGNLPALTQTTYSNRTSNLTFPLQSRALNRAHELGLILARVCRGRESHSASVSLRALRTNTQTQLFWADQFTGRWGRLGALDREDVAVVVARLFAQLRAWRQRCETRSTATRATAAAGGGAQ